MCNKLEFWSQPLAILSKKFGNVHDNFLKLRFYFESK
jgi:hypothetical protein